ncbi:hypothetical protein NIES4071_42740 [Calothrix sp. NIES-4071]|nr:hypothetical protein NIES4071_42740 [Calothrix sp. NIES-4071]BAZ58587.1 hypothetical protein NIES4105_42660 [Calothrix sp. NIES-4105]
MKLFNFAKKMQIVNSLQLFQNHLLSASYFRRLSYWITLSLVIM